MSEWDDFRDMGSSTPTQPARGAVETPAQEPLTGSERDELNEWREWRSMIEAHGLTPPVVRGARPSPPLGEPPKVGDVIEAAYNLHRELTGYIPSLPLAHGEVRSVLEQHLGRALRAVSPPPATEPADVR